MIKTHRVILTGGGTGGHVYPALAVAEQLKKRSDVESITYIGVQGHLEERLAKQNGIDFIGLKVIGLPRKISPKLLSFPWHLSRAVWQSVRIMRKLKPTVVLGTGGYAAAPALSAAVMEKIPIALHEPDSYPGLVNKLFAKKAMLISLGMLAAQTKFEQLTHRGKIVFNGNPVAERFLHLPERMSARQSLGLDPNLPVVLVTGGSQGAEALNQAVYNMLPKIIGAGAVQVLHQVGEKNWTLMERTLHTSIRNHRLYKAKKYFDDLAIAYAACDFAICRSGAMTIAELTVTGTPAIFIPYPYGAQDHQTFNAQYVASTGAARMIPQTQLSGQRLLQEIEELFTDKTVLENMRAQMLTLAKPEAASTLTDLLLNLSD